MDADAPPRSLDHESGPDDVTGLGGRRRRGGKLPTKGHRADGCVAGSVGVGVGIGVASLSTCSSLVACAFLAASGAYRIEGLAPPAGPHLSAPLALPVAQPASAGAVVEQIVALGVLGVGAVVAAWYAMTGIALLACAAAAALGRRWHRGEAAVRSWGAPALRRSLPAIVGVAIGVGLSSGAASAAAPPTVPDDLRWAPTTGPATTLSESPQRRADATVNRGAYVVRPGDSLWSIAARALEERGAATSVAEVGAEWPRWYSANRSVIGPDPNLIHPGQELLAPVEGVHR